MKIRRLLKWVFGGLCMTMGLVVVFIDFFTKAYVHSHIQPLGPFAQHFPYGGIGVFEGFLGGINFSINLVFNKGAAWGVLGQYQNLLLYFRLFLILGIVVYLLFFNRVAARAFFLTLVIAGAIGNVIDYFKYGVVIDFIYFTFWGYSYPLFNVADMAICIGIILLILHALITPADTKKLKKNANSKRA